MDRYYKKRFVPLALPALILFVMVIVIPFIMGVIYSFTAWRGTYFAGGDHFWEAFVGFDNYVKAFKTKKFLDAFVYTIKVTLVAVVAINVVSLAMALLATSLNKALRHTGRFTFCRTCWAAWHWAISGSSFLKSFSPRFCSEKTESFPFLRCAT